MQTAITLFPSIIHARAHAISDLKLYGSRIRTGKWQGIENQNVMHELCDVSFRAPIPHTIEELENQTKCDLPWAEDHFQERVAGEPLNPGVQYQNWPGYKNSNFNDSNFRNAGSNPPGDIEAVKYFGKKFTHTYMERYWPKNAGDVLNLSDRPRMGIMYEYGDLIDVVELLIKDPYTRQAYLPIWFPEDTGVKHGGRVPCTLGYHFILRGGKLHITYYIRACDALRHFRNDIYLTCRLLQWVLKMVQDSVNPHKLEHEIWKVTQAGILTMHIVSFHVFEKELNLI